VVLFFLQASIRWPHTSVPYINDKLRSLAGLRAHRHTYPPFLFQASIRWPHTSIACTQRAHAHVNCVYVCSSVIVPFYKRRTWKNFPLSKLNTMVPTSVNFNIYWQHRIEIWGIQHNVNLMISNDIRPILLNADIDDIETTTIGQYEYWDFKLCDGDPTKTWKSNRVGVLELNLSRIRSSLLSFIAFLFIFIFFNSFMIRKRTW